MHSSNEQNRNELDDLSKREFLDACRDNPNLMGQWHAQHVSPGLPAIWYQETDHGVIETLSGLQLSNCGVPTFIAPSKRLRIIAELSPATITNCYGTFNSALNTCFAPEVTQAKLGSTSNQYFTDFVMGFRDVAVSPIESDDDGSAPMSTEEIEALYKRSDFNAHLADASFAEFLFASNQANSLLSLLASCQSAQERASYCQSLANSHLCAAALLGMAQSGEHAALKTLANFNEGKAIIADLDVAYFIAVACEHNNSEFATIFLQLAKDYYQGDLQPNFHAIMSEDDDVRYNHWNIRIDNTLYLEMQNHHFARLITANFLSNLVEKIALDGFTWIMSHLSDAERNALRAQWVGKGDLAQVISAFDACLATLKHQESFAEYALLSKQCMNDMHTIQHYSQKMLFIALDNAPMSKLLHACLTQAARISKKTLQTKATILPYDRKHDYQTHVCTLRNNHRSMMTLLQQLHGLSSSHFCTVTDQDSGSVQPYIQAVAAKYQSQRHTIDILKSKAHEAMQEKLEELSNQVDLDQRLIANHNPYNTVFTQLTFPDNSVAQRSKLAENQIALSTGLETHAALLRLLHDHHLMIAFCLLTTNDDIFTGNLDKMLPTGINGMRHDALSFAKKIVRVQSSIIEQALDANLVHQLRELRNEIARFNTQPSSGLSRFFKVNIKDAALSLDKKIFEFLMALKSTHIEDPRTGDKQKLTHHQAEALLYNDPQVEEKLNFIQRVEDLKLGFPSMLKSFSTQGLSSYDVLDSFRSRALS